MGETVVLVFDATHSNVAFINFDFLIFPAGFGMYPLVFSQVDVDSVEEKIDVLGDGVYSGKNAVFNLPILEIHLAFNL